MPTEDIIEERIKDIKLRQNFIDVAKRYPGNPYIQRKLRKIYEILNA